MSEENKEIARHFYEAINAGRLEIIDEVVAEDLVEHEEFPGSARVEKACDNSCR